MPKKTSKVVEPFPLCYYCRHLIGAKGRCSKGRMFHPACWWILLQIKAGKVPITHDAAAMEARARWGHGAVIQGPLLSMDGSPSIYNVGYLTESMSFRVIGFGHSWNEAFRSADRIQGKKVPR